MNNTTNGGMALMSHTEVSLWVRITFIVYLLVINFVGVPGNIMASIIYARKSPKAACDWLILIMSVTDAVVCFCSPVFYLRVALRIYFPGKRNTLCLLENWFHFAAMIASCLILVVIALDRYMKICRPGLASLTPIRARNVGLLCVAVSAAVCIFPFVDITGKTRCHILGTRPPDHIIHYCMIILSGFIISFFIVTFAYACICKQISDKNKLKRRLLEDNGLKSPTNNAYKHGKDLRNRSKSWWQRMFFQCRVEQSKMSVIPKEKDEIRYKSCQYNKLFDYFKDEGCLPQERGISLNTHESISDKDSTTRLYHDVVAANIETSNLKEYGSCFVTSMEQKFDKNSTISCTEHNEKMAHENLSVYQDNDNQYLDTLAQRHISVSIVLAQPEDSSASNSDLGSPKFLGQENEEIYPNTGALICNCFVRQTREEITRDYINLTKSLSDRSKTDNRKKMADLCFHTGTCKLTKVLYQDTMQSEDNLVTRTDNVCPTKIRAIELCPIHAQLSESEKESFDNEILCFRQKLSDDLREQSILPVSINCAEFGFYESRIIRSISVCTSWKKSNSLSQRTINCIQWLPGQPVTNRIRSHMKRAVSCPDVTTCDYDRSIRLASWFTNLRMCSRHSLISDRVISKVTYFQTNTKRDIELKHRTCSKDIKPGDTTTIQLPQCFPLRDITQTICASNSKMTENTNEDINNLVLEDKYTNVTACGKCPATKTQDQPFCPVPHECTFDSSNPEVQKLSTCVTLFRSASTNPIFSEFQEPWLMNLSSKFDSDIAKHGCCSYLEIFNSFSRSSAKICSEHTNNHQSTCHARTTLTTAENDTLDLNQSHIELRENLPAKKDFLTLPRIFSGNIRQQKCPASEGIKTTSHVPDLFHRRSQIDTGCSVQEDDICSDIPTEQVSISTCWRQNDGGKVTNSKMSKYKLKSISGWKRYSRERQMTLMLVSVTSVYLMSWIPAWIMYMIWFYWTTDDSTSVALLYFSKICLLNYATSPVIYYAFNPSFRSNVKGLMTPLFKCVFCCRK